MVVKKYSRNTFYCFSPLVMIVTFIVELLLAVYTLWRYRYNPVTRLVVLLLVFLATFQLAEYMVCRGLGGDSSTWSRIGFVAITVLPPVGMHLVYTLAKARKRPLLLPAYALGAAFIAFFALVGRSIDGHACAGNYVIFQVAPGFGALYSLYYYGLLIATLGLGWSFLRQARDKNVRRAIGGVMLGYAVFLLPTTTVTLLKPETMSAVPSVMCGFAVLLALTLCFVVLPASVKSRS